MKTQAIVVAKDGEYATVEAVRSSACEGCHKMSGEAGCSVCSLMGGERKISAKAKNTVNAEVGDRVSIESASGTVIAYAAMVFLFPLMLAMVSYLVASHVTERETWHFLAFLAGFIGTFAVVFAYSNNIRKKRCDIEITEILQKNINGT